MQSLVDKLLFNFFTTKLVTAQAITGKEYFIEPLNVAIQALPHGLDTTVFFFACHSSWSYNEVEMFIQSNLTTLTTAIYRYLTQRRQLTDNVEWLYEIILSSIANEQQRRWEISVRTPLYHYISQGVVDAKGVAHHYHSHASSYNAQFTDEEYASDLMCFLSCATIKEFNDVCGRWLQSNPFLYTGYTIIQCLYTLYCLGYLDIQACIWPTSINNRFGPTAGDVRSLRYYTNCSSERVLPIVNIPHVHSRKARLLGMHSRTEHTSISYPTLELIISRYIDMLLTDGKAFVARGYLRIRVRDEYNKGKPYNYWYPLAGLKELSSYMKDLFTTDPLTIILQYLTHCA